MTENTQEETPKGVVVPLGNLKHLRVLHRDGVSTWRGDVSIEVKYDSRTRAVLLHIYFPFEDKEVLAAAAAAACDGKVFLPEMIYEKGIDDLGMGWAYYIHIKPPILMPAAEVEAEAPEAAKRVLMVIPQFVKGT